MLEVAEVGNHSRYQQRLLLSKYMGWVGVGGIMSILKIREFQFQFTIYNFVSFLSGNYPCFCHVCCHFKNVKQVKMINEMKMLISNFHHFMQLTIYMNNWRWWDGVKTTLVQRAPHYTQSGAKVSWEAAGTALRSQQPSQAAQLWNNGAISWNTLSACKHLNLFQKVSDKFRIIM